MKGQKRLEREELYIRFGHPDSSDSIGQGTTWLFAAVHVVPSLLAVVQRNETAAHPKPKPGAF